VIEIEASPINQYDLLLIAGGYGYRPQLPSIMSTEGIGRGGCAGKTREGRGPDIGAVPPSDLGRARQPMQKMSPAFIV
jgi:hypothetical protein